MGELLDAAVQLLRGRTGLWLLVAAAGLAIAEQSLLYPMRRQLGIDLISGFEGGFGETVLALYVVTAFGAGFEAMIINALGPLAGRSAAHSVLQERPRGHLAWWRTLVTAPIVGLLTTVGVLLGPLWVLGYALFGVSGAAIGLEDRGAFRALGRGARLAFRGGGRVTGVRLLGYLAWLLLRFAFFLALLQVMSMISASPVTGFWVLTVGFTVINAAAYAYLAALDASALVESRFRAEAWDIWLTRARSKQLAAEAVR